MKKLLGIVAICVLFVGVLLINIHCLPLHDELAYAFAGMMTPMTGIVPRTDSISMFVARQVNDYINGDNGRIIVHSVVSAFSAMGAYFLFDVVNSFVWMAFVALLMKYGKVSFTLRNYVLIFFVAFALLWYSESCSFDSAFAINYLWMAVITLFAMASWVKGRPNAILFFLFGWTQETFVLPFVAAGAVEMAFRRPMSWRKPLCWLSMVAGAASLILAPSACHRASGELTGGIVRSILLIVGVLPRMAFYLAPIVLFVALGYIAYRKIMTHGMKRCVVNSPFEVLYVLASLGMTMFLPRALGPRLIMAMGSVGFMLMLRYRSCLPNWMRWPHFRLCAAILIGVWFALTVMMQVSAGRDNQHMLESYAKGGDLTRSYVPTFGYAVDRGQFNKWQLRLIQLEYGRDKIGKLTTDFETPDWVKAIRETLPPCLYARIKYLLPDREALTTVIE